MIWNVTKTLYKYNVFVVPYEIAVSAYTRLKGADMGCDKNPYANSIGCAVKVS